MQEGGKVVQTADISGNTQHLDGVVMLSFILPKWFHSGNSVQNAVLISLEKDTWSDLSILRWC